MNKGYVDVYLKKVHYLSGGSGALILLLHQSGRSALMFHDVLKILSEKYFVVAIDLPGSGMSDNPEADVTIDDLADLCATVIAHFKRDRAFVYGHHSGNKIAAALAVRHPQMVERLILAGQSHSIIPDRKTREAAIEKFVKPYQTIAKIKDPFVARHERWSKAYRSLTSTWWSAGLSSSDGRDYQIARNTAIDIIQSIDGAAAIYKANVAFDLEQAYRKITVKTLVLEIVTPEEDERLGRYADTVCALIPNSSSMIIEHDNEDGVTLERKPEDLAKIMLEFF